MTEVRHSDRTLNRVLLAGVSHRHSIKLVTALLIAAGLCTAADLPEGTGKTETARLCTECHSIEQATSLRQTRAGWTETISKMVDLGAEGRDEEFGNPQLSGQVLWTCRRRNRNNYARDDGRVGGEIRESRQEISPTCWSFFAACESWQRARRAACRQRSIDAENEWRTYGHDRGALRFSPLNQITPQNVTRLKVAWVYHMRPAGFTAAKNQSPTATDSHRSAGAVGDEPETAATTNGRMQLAPASARAKSRRW